VSKLRDEEKFVMQKVISFLPPIQVGYEIYYEDLEIEGIEDRQTTVWQFIQGSNQLLDWEQEPSNPKDPNAIKIIGVSEQIFSTKHELLGYIPGDVAKQIVGSGLWPFLQLRLDCIYIAKQGFIAIRFQILGPIRTKKRDVTTNNRSSLELERETKIPAVKLSSLQSKREIAGQKERQITFKRVVFFFLRCMTITIGIGFALAGGKMGTAVWQDSENFSSMVMLFPVALIISGGLLIWIGIRPTKPKENP
jgi:hypothetical protein